MSRGSSDNLVHYTPKRIDLRGSSPAQALAQELEEVDKGRAPWREVCFVQSLCARFGYVPIAVAVAPDIQLLAGAGSRNPRVKAKGPAEDDAPVIQRGEKLDIAFWPPPRQVDYQKIPPRQIHERPVEGIIFGVKTNKDISVQIEGRNTKVNRFGDVGGSSGNTKPPVCHGRTHEQGE